MEFESPLLLDCLLNVGIERIQNSVWLFIRYMLNQSSNGCLKEAPFGFLFLLFKAFVFSGDFNTFDLIICENPMLNEKLYFFNYKLML